MSPSRTRDEAQAVAEAAYDLRARRFVTVDGTAEGNAQLRVGAHVTLSGAQRRSSTTPTTSCAPAIVFDLRAGLPHRLPRRVRVLGG